MSIFDYIENKSNELGNKLGKNETEDDREVYCYAIFGILSQCFTFGIGFIIAYVLGILKPFTLVTISFVSLRIGGGGYHCSCFRDCFITSSAIFFIGTIMAIYMQDYVNMMLIIGILLGIYILPICPKPSKNSPTRGYKGDIKFRKKYRNALILLICINIIFIHAHQYLYATSISSGIIITAFMISDFGENITTKFWNFVHNIKK